MTLMSFHATYLFSLLRSKFQIFKWGTVIVPPVLSCESSLHKSGYKLYYQVRALQVFSPSMRFVLIFLTVLFKEVFYFDKVQVLYFSFMVRVFCVLFF